MPEAAHITAPLPGQMHNVSRIGIEIALAQDAMYAAVDPRDAEKAAGAFVQEGAQRLSIRHHHKLGRDVGEDQLKDRAWSIMQQSDAGLQVNVPVSIATLDQQLRADKLGIGRSRDAAMAYVLWVGDKRVTLPEGDPSACRYQERPGR